MQKFIQIRRLRLWPFSSKTAAGVAGKKTVDSVDVEDEIVLIRDSALFDENWYFARYGDTFGDEIDAVRHYVVSGAWLGQAPHPLFDQVWYARQTANLPKIRVTPLTHYLLIGVGAGISPHPLFDPTFYAEQRGHNLSADVNPLLDFVREGFRGGISPHPAFDARYYIAQVSGDNLADTNPLTHFVAVGAGNGLKPNRLFDTVWYMDRYAAMLVQDVNPLVHFLQTGATLKLLPHPDYLLERFQPMIQNLPSDAAEAYCKIVRSGLLPTSSSARDARSSARLSPQASSLAIIPAIARYLDLTWFNRNAGTNFKDREAAATYYVQEGERSGINPTYLFDVAYYRATNMDTMEENAFYDYIKNGWSSNARPHILFDVSYYIVQAGIENGSIEPLLHFIVEGARRGYSPNPLFDPGHLRRRYGGVWKTVCDPLRYYLESPLEALVETHPLFWGSYYWSRSKKSFPATVPALWHYFQEGMYTDVSPHPLFDCEFYLTKNLDVANDAVPPLLHFVRDGGREGRDPSRLFQTLFYERQRPREVWQSDNALVDYQISDAAAWLAPHPNFDPVYFRAKYEQEFDARLIRPLAYFALCSAFRTLQCCADPGGAVTMTLAGRPLEQRRSTLPRIGGIIGMWPRRSILHVTHGLGGGTWTHAVSMCEELRRQGHATLLLRYESGGTGASILLGDKVVFSSRYDNAASAEALTKFLKSQEIDFIHFHQILNAAKLIRGLPMALGVPYYVTAHDYYYMCPQVTCIGSTGQYCGLPSVDICNRCVDVVGPYDGLAQELREHGGNVAIWRASHAEWLKRATRVFVPSDDAADRMTRTLGIAVTVRPHPEPIVQLKLSVPPDDLPLRVLILGSIGPHKGSEILLKCAYEAYIHDLPIAYYVVGEIAGADRFDRLPNVTVGHKYPQHSGHAALRFGQYHCALFLSVWPETFAYTLSEVLEAGVFPITFDIGAIFERLRALDWGYAIPLASEPEEINQAVLQLCNLRIPPPNNTFIGHKYDDYLRDYYGEK
jgi:glycosyltransferase involved in cell wall biosynthesis